MNGQYDQLVEDFFYCVSIFEIIADLEMIGSESRVNDTGVPGHACTVCGKMFRNLSWLKRHMTSHTGERPFKCEICGKAFGLKGNLRHHMALHYVNSHILGSD